MDSEITREDIIRMALEAGFREPNPHDGYMGLAYDYRDGTDTGASLERFAALVAAAEREACGALIQRRYMGDHNREDQEVLRCAAAIRARGNT